MAKRSAKNANGKKLATQQSVDAAIGFDTETNLRAVDELKAVNLSRKVIIDTQTPVAQAIAALRKMSAGELTLRRGVRCNRDAGRSG